MPRDFRSEDERKRVVTADGDTVGTVERTESGRAQITPDQGLSQSVRRRLGWSEEDEDMYELQSSKVEEITDDEIRLKRDL